MVDYGMLMSTRSRYEPVEALAELEGWEEMTQSVVLPDPKDEERQI